MLVVVAKLVKRLTEEVDVKRAKLHNTTLGASLELQDIRPLLLLNLDTITFNGLALVITLDSNLMQLIRPTINNKNSPVTKILPRKHLSSRVQQLILPNRIIHDMDLRIASVQCKQTTELRNGNFAERGLEFELV